MCSNMKKSPDEGSAKFGATILAERHKLYSEHFKEYPQLSLSQYEFNRVSKVIDDKVRNWRHRGDKETYLSTFPVARWKMAPSMEEITAARAAMATSVPATKWSTHFKGIIKH